MSVAANAVLPSEMSIIKTSARDNILFFIGGTSIKIIGIFQPRYSLLQAFYSALHQRLQPLVSTPSLNNRCATILCPLPAPISFLTGEEKMDLIIA